MKIRLPCRLALCVAAAALMLLSMTAIQIPCDEDCNAEAPTCECVCVCYGNEAAAPETCVLFDVSLARFAGQQESSQRSILLNSDIFRPPIA